MEEFPIAVTRWKSPAEVPVLSHLEAEYASYRGRSKRQDRDEI